MNAALHLFSRTFRRIPAIDANAKSVMKSIKGIYEPVVLGKQPSIADQTARIMYLSREIAKQAAQIQQQDSTEVLAHFDKKYAAMTYDYGSASFKLVKARDNTRYNYSIQSIAVEKVDHPFSRQSLYFHELKNIQKYMDISYSPGLPKFWKDFEKMKAQNENLDKENPLGFPHWAEPLQLRLEIVEGGTICEFNLAYKLGEVKIGSISNIKPSYRYEMNPDFLSERSQQIVFLLLKKKAGLNPEEIEEMSKLAFIGGRVQKVDMMLDLLEHLSRGIICA